MYTQNPVIMQDVDKEYSLLLDTVSMLTDRVNELLYIQTYAGDKAGLTFILSCAAIGLQLPNIKLSLDDMAHYACVVLTKSQKMTITQMMNMVTLNLTFTEAVLVEEGTSCYYLYPADMFPCFENALKVYGVTK